jgi:hypothetical protein
MPTLVNQTEDTESYFEGGGETAGPSGMFWMAQNLDCEDATAANDSTMSGSFLETTLENMRRRELVKTQTQKATESMVQQLQAESAKSFSRSRTHSDEDLLLSRQHPLAPQNGNERGRMLSKDSNVTKETEDADQHQMVFAVGKTHDDSDRSLSRAFDNDDLVAHLRATQGEPQLRVESSTNDSLSRTFTEEDIVALRQQSSQYVEKLNETSHRSTSLHESTASCHEERSPRIERKMGPNEQHYIQKYSSFVTNQIEAFRLKYPGQLQDYRTMTDEKKLLAQQNVMKLLARLNITNNNKENTHFNEEDDDVCLAHRLKPAGAKDLAFHQSDDESLSIYATNQSGYADNDQSIVLLSPTKDADKSTTLLSPDPPHSPTLKISNRHQTLFSPIEKEKDDANTSMVLLSPPNQMRGHDDAAEFPDADQSDDNSSTQSIEVARAAADHQYESPETLRKHKKRLASTSGKRGTDLSRARRDDLLLHETSPGKFLAHSIGRLSLGDEAIFTLSQSPIAHQLTYPQEDVSPPEFAPLDISFGDDNDDLDRSVAAKSRSVCDSDSLVETAMLPDKRVRWDFDGKLTKEAPTNVRLLDGQTFHLQKLITERRQRDAPPTQTFPDPLCFYPDKLQRRLNRLYTWLLQRDLAFAQNESVGSAVVLSMQEQQITDVILKLHLDYLPSEEAQTRSGSGKQGPLQGNTLIVARSKDELEVWSRSFREGSAYSVLNHAALPLAQRKSLSSAEKAVRFDVVLTTYDALKSPDITVTLDGSGFTVNTKIGVNEGWYTSASQRVEVERCNKQFSVLHRVNWRRLVFIDVLGRKSYLVKAGTARVHAARALNAEARLAFFVVSDENETTGFQALTKSDRTALPSLCCVLRLADVGTDGTKFRENIVDFHDKSTYLAMTRNRPT